MFFHRPPKSIPLPFKYPLRWGYQLLQRQCPWNSVDRTTWYLQVCTERQGGSGNLGQTDLSNAQSIMSNGRVRRRLVGLGGIRRQILVHLIGLAWACFSPLHQGSETANWDTNKATRNTQVLSKSCLYVGFNSIPASCWPQQATQHHPGRNRSYQEAISAIQLLQAMRISSHHSRRAGEILHDLRSFHG